MCNPAPALEVRSLALQKFKNKTASPGANSLPRELARRGLPG
jgi:hypothetical protein